MPVSAWPGSSTPCYSPHLPLPTYSLWCTIECACVCMCAWSFIAMVHVRVPSAPTYSPSSSALAHRNLSIVWGWKFGPKALFTHQTFLAWCTRCQLGPYLWHPGRGPQWPPSIWCPAYQTCRSNAFNYIWNFTHITSGCDFSDLQALDAQPAKPTERNGGTDLNETVRKRKEKERR